MVSLHGPFSLVFLILGAFFECYYHIFVNSVCGNVSEISKQCLDMVSTKCYPLRRGHTSGLQLHLIFVLTKSINISGSSTSLYTFDLVCSFPYVATHFLFLFFFNHPSSQKQLFTITISNS